MKRSTLIISIVTGFILVAALVLVVSGPVVGAVFSRTSQSLEGVPPYYESDAPEAYALPAATAMPPAAADKAQGGGGTGAANVERIVIQNADLAIVVSDVEARMKEIEAMAVRMGGFVVSSSLYQSYTSNNVKAPEAMVVVRVPSEKLDEALGLIKKDVVEVQNESRTGTDVTAEYVDLQSRLKNLEAAEAQLQEILEKAEKTEDVINVFNQLVYYREQIELVKGQIEYYDQAAALSAVSVRIIAEETIQPIEIAGWKPEGVAREAVQDLIYFFQDFASFLIRFVIYTLPVLISIGVPLYLIFLGGRAIYRRARRKAGREQSPPPPEK
jgi:hypothetical protein